MAAVAGAQIAVDPKLPEYKAKSGVAGKIDTVGSDTMNNVATVVDRRVQEVLSEVYRRRSMRKVHRTRFQRSSMVQLRLDQ